MDVTIDDLERAHAELGSWDRVGERYGEKGDTLRKRVERARKRARKRERPPPVVNTRSGVRPWPKPSAGAKRGTQHETAVLCVADCHYGKVTASYNADVFADRMRMLGGSMAQIRELLAMYVIDELVVLMSGDEVDGDGIYPGQAHYQDPSNVDAQVTEWTEIMAAWLANLVPDWGTLRIECVAGNHGRAGKAAHIAANWDLTAYRELGYLLGDNAEVRWSHEEPFIRRVDLRGHTGVLYHGHGIRMYQQIPWYGIAQRVMRWSTTQALGGFDVAYMGHFHQSGLQYVNRIPVLLSGTHATDDEWALQYLGLEAVPRWWLHGVSDHRIITWMYPLDLTPVRS